MPEIVEHEVEYHEWCKLCAYKDYPESKDPCHSCLYLPFNAHSKRPVFWKEGAKND